jgi:hypothetical protein
MNAPSDSSQAHNRQVLLVAVAVTALVAYKLLEVAQATGNYEGMWFSLFHTVLVAVATVLALRDVQH